MSFCIAIRRLAWVVSCLHAFYCDEGDEVTTTVVLTMLLAMMMMVMTVRKVG